MAECEKIMQLCEESLDRTLTQEEQQALDRHLADCPACAAYLADLKFLSGALADPPELPAGLHENIMSRVRADISSTIVQTHRPMRPVRRMPMITMLAAAAACVVLVLSGAVGDLMNTFTFQLGSGGGMNGTGSMNRSSGAAQDTAPAVASAEGTPTEALQVPATITTGGDADAGAADTGGAGAAGAGGADAGGAGAAGAGSANPGGVGAVGANSDGVDAGGADTGNMDAAADASPGSGEPGIQSRSQKAAVPEGRSAPAPQNEEALPSEDSTEQYSETAETTVSPSASAAVYYAADTRTPQPQVGAFISGVMKGEVFAACYLVEGGSGLPEIGQEQQRDECFAYYAVDNNLAQLEILLDSLEKAGCTVSRYEESGVLFNATAERVIFVVRLS